MVGITCKWSLYINYTQIIADFVFSMVAMLNFNIDYEKMISLFNGFVWFLDYENVGFASKIKSMLTINWYINHISFLW